MVCVQVVGEEGVQRILAHRPRQPPRIAGACACVWACLPRARSSCLLARRTTQYRHTLTCAHRSFFFECVSVCFIFALSQGRIVICCRFLFPVVNWELVAVSHASSDVVQWRGADRRTCRACWWACGCAGAIRWVRMKMMTLHFKYSDSLCWGTTAHSRDPQRAIRQ